MVRPAGLLHARVPRVRRASFRTLSLSFVLLLAASCGRSPALPGGADGGILPVDGPRHERWPGDFWPPPPPGDFWPPPPPGDFWPPPPPPGDFWPPPPPPGDFWPPPPPGDFWPPPPPGDFWPPPDICGCTQICSLLVPCGLSTGYGKCQADCAGYPPAQLACLKKVACSWGATCPAAKACFSPTLQPDLVISGFAATVTGSTVNYSVVACNKGQAAAGAFYVDVYYDRPTAPGVGEFGEVYQDYPGLAPGACITAKLTRAGAPSGTQTSWAQVDADGVVSESLESNNLSGPIQVVVGGPPPMGVDLALTSFKATVSGSTTASVTYQMQICNQGTAGSPASEVHVYYSLPSPPPAGQNGDAFTAVPALQPGACTTRSVVRSGVPPGAYSSFSRVDPANTIAESNESNNTAGPLTVTVGTAPGADLTIKKFTSQLIGQTTVRYQVQVCNSGTGASGTAQVHVYFNRGSAPGVGLNGDQLTYVPNLGPGACSTQNLYRYGTPAGSYTSWAQVDPLNLVAETSESNNVAGPILVVVAGSAQQAELAITQLDAKVSGTTISFTTKVCNNGSLSAQSFRVDLYYNRTTAPKVGDLGDVYDLVPALAAGGCVTLTRSAVNLKPGLYTSWAQVDASNTVSESNELNNLAGPRISVVAGGTIVDCNAICALAISCSLYFNASQLQQCLSWCANLPTASRQCASAALPSCAALKACNLPAPPPPPPPPGVCPDLCSYLISPCNLLPSSQYWTCVGACENLTPAKIQCAQDAKASSQCMGIVSCMF